MCCARSYSVGIVMNHHAQIVISSCLLTTLAYADVTQTHSSKAACSYPGDRSRHTHWLDPASLTPFVLSLRQEIHLFPHAGLEAPRPLILLRQGGLAPPQRQHVIIARCGQIRQVDLLASGEGQTVLDTFLAASRVVSSRMLEKEMDMFARAV